ncbi:flagellar hook-length control protein FliK [Lutispora thermophila]|uniref:Hook-length control protein FliK n=1 Tax=Lutispora thermophila DSM 19022 TaxID=1122184 RepID=A0A1M6G6Y9_9FIRM|nr:flagellar hook-length control protein FliK [Lutispora thermophila]SHJ05679.1 hook-length control protein FliK [Lutispora thermophila DSM 19022]
MIMIDFNSMLNGKTMDVKANAKLSFNSDNTGVDYKQIMQKAIQQKGNEQTSKKAEASRVDDSNKKDKYINKEADQKSINTVKEEKDVKETKEVSARKEAKDIKEDEFEQESSKDDDMVKEIDIVGNILLMLSGMLNLEINDMEKVKDILQSELNQIDYSTLDKSVLIENINAITKDIKIEDMDDFNEIINDIKSLIINEVAISNEAEEHVNIDSNSTQLNQIKDTVLNGLNLLEHSSFNRVIKPVSEMQTAQIQENHEEVEGKSTDIGAESVEEAEIVAKIDNEIQMKNHDSEYPEIQHKISNDVDDIAINYAAIGEKAFDIQDNLKAVDRNPLIDRPQFINNEEIFKQIVESSQLLDTDEFTELRIRLKPESLGKVTVKLIMENGEMTAKFIAENQRVKEAIESSFVDLKESLTQKGINIQNISVSVGNQEKWQKENDNFSAWKSNSKRTSYVEDIVTELDENISNYENPYYINEGLLDIRV